MGPRRVYRRGAVLGCSETRASAPLAHRSAMVGANFDGVEAVYDAWRSPPLSSLRGTKVGLTF